MAVNHQVKFARFETAAIAANLVQVPGYCYVDIPKGEVDQIIATLRKSEQRVGIKDLFAAASAHSIVANDPKQNTARATTGKEAGFLTLFSFTSAPPAGIDEQLATSAQGQPPAATLDIAGTTVYRFDYPDSRDSRYQYVWLRHGVQGAIDGAGRVPLEKWLRKYLAIPVLVGGETPALSAQLVSVPGFVYVNFDSSTVTQEFVTGPLGEVVSSSHQVADADGAVGGLMLSEVPATLSTSQFVTALQRFGLAGFTDAGSAVIGTTTTEHLTTTDVEGSGLAGHVYVWVRDGIAGVFLTAYPDRAAPFLAAFLT